LSLQPLGGVLAGTLAFVLLLAPPGYWLLRRAGGGAPRALDLGLALGVGWSAVLPLLWLERLLGAPVLVLPAVALSVIALRREWAGWPTPRPDRLFWLLPVLAGALVFWVDGADARWDAAGASFRAGFDVTDRAFYGLVSQEIARSPPPSMQNPLFAGAPLSYSFFPALAGLLLHLYGGQAVLTASLLVLPVAGFAFLALALDALLREWGHVSTAARALTLLLCVLGGDLSFAFPARGVAGGERTAHFLAFCSFSSESLYYNPWVFGLPLLLVVLVLAGRWLEGRGSGWLWLAAWCLAALWQTKVFACVPLLLGAGLAALLLRQRRLALLAAASALLTVPWAATSLAARASGFRPFVPAPFCPVMLSLSVHPQWRALADLCASADAWVRWPAALGATAIVLAGGMGVRLVGLPGLLRRARQDALGAWLGLAMACAVVLSLTIGGQPTLLDCVQFLMLPQLLLWIFAGPRLGEWVAAGGARRAVALLLAALACVGPLGYVLRKARPEWFPAAPSVDRLRVRLSSDALAAADWLARSPRGRANLVADWRAGFGDPGRRPVYVALIAGKRLAANAENAHVAPALADERRRMVAEVYDTADAARAEALLDALRADWVWVDTARPLRFQSERLPLRARFPGVEIHEHLPRVAPP
jgi:hypothetical protein